MIRKFGGIKPQIGTRCYIDETAVVIGDVVLEDDVSIWPMTVVRGDVNSIHIGCGTNIQDGSVLHVSHKGKFNDTGGALVIKDHVTVGHKAMLHACTIESNCLIGMGSIVMDHALIESNVMLGAGSLVPGGKVLDSGYLWLGNPVKRIRKLSQQEIEYLEYSAAHYVQLKNKTIETSENL